MATQEGAGEMEIDNFPQRRTWKNEIPFTFHDQDTSVHSMPLAIIAYLEADLYQKTGRPTHMVSLSARHLIDCLRAEHPDALPPFGHDGIGLITAPVWKLHRILEWMFRKKFGAISIEDYARVNHRHETVMEQMVRIRVEEFTYYDLDQEEGVHQMHEAYEDRGPVLIEFPVVDDFDRSGKQIYEAKTWSRYNLQCDAVDARAALLTGHYPIGYFGPRYGPYRLAQYLNCHTRHSDTKVTEF